MEKIIKTFLEHKSEMDKKEKKGNVPYAIEFMSVREKSQSLRMDSGFSSEEGEKSQNIDKNRYKDILPFDHCRVKLKGGKDSDYINASFLKSPTQQLYIASQGPLQKTLEDFWSMIWQQEVITIVMACLENEGNPPKNKCQRYWPLVEEDLKVGPFSIKLIEEFIYAASKDSITHKRLLVKKDGETREIQHIHHTDWPDKLIPTCVTSILLLVSIIRATHPVNSSQPLLIHCSAGCGRTGTIIVIDFIRTLLNTEKLSADFSIYNIVCNMRRQRTSIVQSQEQYAYVYMAVEELFKEYLSKHKADLESDYYEVVNNSQTSPQVRSPIKSPGVAPSFKEPLYAEVKVTSKGEKKVANVVDEDHVTLERFLQPESSVSTASTKTSSIFRGYQIGFPNRVAKPHGPRLLPLSLR